MFNVCPGCGLYSEDKDVAAATEAGRDWAYATCPTCGHRHLFRRPPLYVLTGASGAGKTSVTRELATTCDEAVVLEADVLLGSGIPTEADNYHTYYNVWLRLVKNVAQAGRPVLLSGSMVHERLAHCAERRYIGAIHYLALVCDSDELRRRLEARPAWRRSGHSKFVAEHMAFNTWLRTHGPQQEPPIRLLDTTNAGVPETATQVQAWVRSRGDILAAADDGA